MRTNKATPDRFPHYRQLIKKRNIDALVQAIHKRALSSTKQNSNPKAALMKHRMHRLRGVKVYRMTKCITTFLISGSHPVTCGVSRQILFSLPCLGPTLRGPESYFIIDHQSMDLALFLAEPAQRKELITEYCGDVISSLVADIRERLYAESGLKSVYMFSIKNNYVIDATLKGNFARFLNHSCAPTAESVHARFSASNNALEPVSLISQSQGIAISMLSNLGEGAEVTQNYYLSKESADNKLFCQCGSTRCRLYMN